MTGKKTMDNYKTKTVDIRHDIRHYCHINSSKEE
jgi:hypothetical protein